MAKKAVDVYGRYYHHMKTTMLKLSAFGCWLPSDLSANPKLFPLPAEIPNQPDCSETRDATCREVCLCTKK